MSNKNVVQGAGAPRPAMAIMYLCGVILLFVMAEVGARCTGSTARFFPEYMITVGNPTPRETAPTIVNRGDSDDMDERRIAEEQKETWGLPVNIVALSTLAFAGACVALAKWRMHDVDYAAGISEASDKMISCAAKREWARADISATFLAAGMGVLVLLTSLGRFIEMHEHMNNNIRMTRRTLDQIAAVHVDIEGMRDEITRRLMQNGMKQDAALRLSKQLAGNLNDLRTKAGVVALNKLDSIKQAVTLGNPGAPGLGALDSSFLGLRRRLERIEEHIGSAPAVPGRKSGEM